MRINTIHQHTEIPVKNCEELRWIKMKIKQRINQCIQVRFIIYHLKLDHFNPLECEVIFTFLKLLIVILSFLDFQVFKNQYLQIFFVISLGCFDYFEAFFSFSGMFLKLIIYSRFCLSSKYKKLLFLEFPHSRS